MDRQQLILEGKKQYGKVFSASYMGEDIIFRPLTSAEVKEYIERSKYESSIDLEESVVERCVIWPIDGVDTSKSAGFVSSLCDQIREYSGFSDEEVFITELEKAREESVKVTNLIKAFIIAAMPSLSLDEVENLSIYKSAELLALSEKILELRDAGAPRLIQQDAEEEADPVKSKLMAGMMQAIHETNMDVSNLEKPG